MSGADFISDDIRNIQESALSPFISSEDILLFSGCAPCQPFSRQNRSLGVSDTRRSLLSEFSRFVSFWRPDYVFVENVPGLQRIKASEGPLAAFLSCLTAEGYKFSLDVVPALSFGVPQTRERLILMASRHGEITIPKGTHGRDGARPSTVRDWISDLPAIRAGEVHTDDQDHVAMKLSPLNLERISLTPQGKGRESWPDSLWLNCHKAHKGHSDVYGRLAWDKPASGLTTRCISYSNGRFGHPEQNRAISVREAACLQTFPRSYKFCGSTESKARQIGNAVPPLMAQRFGEAFSNHAKTVFRG